VFGKDAARGAAARVSFPSRRSTRASRRTGTNLEKGLELAAAMLPEEHIGRVVLISDGRRRKETWDGDWMS